MTSSDSDETLKLVSMAYGVAIQPDRFDDLLTAWDDWFDANILDTEGAFDRLASSFDDAVSAAESLEGQAPHRSAMDLSPSPGILLDKAGAVLDVNSAATALLALEGCEAKDLLATAQKSDFSVGQEKLGAYRLGGGQQSRTYLAVEAPISETIRRQYPAAGRFLLLSLMDWSDAFSDELADRLNLSDAQLRVAKGLLEGLTAQEISGDLDRSVATIRSHIKALLRKTGARRQTELVQLLTILRQTAETAPLPAKADNATTDFQTVELSGPAGVLSVVEYGEGTPVLYFTTSSRPEEVASVRSAFAASGLRIIAPARPGFRGTAPASGCASEALLNDWLDLLMERAGPAPIFAGHREGGILAAKAAARAVKSGRAIGGLALISTGAPVAKVSQFKHAPPTIRRSFLGAHYAHTAVVLGYKTAARIFRTGKAGENKIVQYFSRDSPADAIKLSDPLFYEITRDNIAYCFIEPTQIVKDIADWTTDWSSVIETIKSATDVLFIHGELHTFQKMDDILEVCAGEISIKSFVVSGAAQLALYEQPFAVGRAIRSMSSEDGAL